MKLNDRKIKALKPTAKPAKYGDGHGLHLYVTPNGSKLWRMSYRFEGKQKLLSFGKYPLVPLSRARELCLEAKRQLTEGIDPRAEAHAARAEYLAKHEHTFGKIAEEYLNKRSKEGLSKVTLQKKAWFIRRASAHIGGVPVKELTAQIVLIPLRKEEEKGNYENAKRLRSTIGQVMRYAIATGRADYDPTPALRDALISPRVKHRAAMTKREDFENLVQTIWRYDGSSPIIMTALKLMVFLYTRPGELRLARWDEFDFKKGVWRLPAERMKMRREHMKPLAKPVIKIFKELQTITGDQPRVFPSLTGRDRPISENTMNQTLRRMSFSPEEMTSHGFRASACSLINESGKWNPDAIEAELAHADPNQVRRIYHRALYWEERVAMAEWWALEVQGFANS